MHVENITSNAMSLDRNGQSMLIQVYEKEIDRLNNIINELEIFIKNNKVAIGIKKGSNYAIPVEYVLDKLKELKDNNK